MKGKIFNVFVCIFIAIACASYQVHAQEGSPPVAGAQPSAPGPSSQGTVLPPSPIVQPQNPYQAGFSQGQTSPVPQQGTTPVTGSQGVAQQQGTQGEIQPQTPGVSQPITSVPESLSSVEASFQDSLLVRAPAEGGESLKDFRQFGYSLFNRNISTFAPVEDVPVGPEYVLGPGDELRISIWGAMENSYTVTVDRYGRIYLPTVGPVRVWGLTYAQAEKLVQMQLSQYYKGFQISVTMGHLRTIKIYIVGEVNQPGAYTISSLSTLTNALFAAGGPSKSGSLRTIELKRNHRTENTFDFYSFLLHGDKSKDTRLESGDVVFLPPIGPVAGIIGQIKRPAIYELEGITRVGDLIEMAGGLTPQSYLKRVQIIRPKPNAEKEVIDIDLLDSNGKINVSNDIEVKNGDLVRVYPTDSRIYNTVNVDGPVKQPGEYEVKPGMRISQILPKEALFPEAYPDAVEVVRYKEDLTIDVININLRKAWEGDQAQDIVLHPRDQISVRSEYKPGGTIVLSGEVKLPGTYTVERWERISSVIKRAGGFTDKAYLKGTVFIRSSMQAKEKARLDDFVQQFKINLLSQQSALASYTGDDRSLQQFQITQQEQQINLLASRITLGRIVVHLDYDLEKFEGSENDLMLESGDSIHIPKQPAEVMVYGSVRNPTSIIHKKGQNIEYYINRGGGFTKYADRKEMYLVKADGSAIVGFLKLRDVEAGDAIIVPPKSTMLNWTFVKDIATVAGQTALGMAALAAVF
ncbi:MAG: SLBB domain-containing protein [Candidatus Brocadiaceae bacterium]